MYYKEDRTMFYGFLLPRGPRSSNAGARDAEGRRPATADDVIRRFTVRLAEPADRPALEQLAGLDSARVPSGTVLVGEMGGGIQAAVPVSGGRAIANPFVRTAELVKLLELRAGQLRELGIGEEDSARVIPLPRRRPSFAGRVA
jgi:hypothetical protein